MLKKARVRLKPICHRLNWLMLVRVRQKPKQGKNWMLSAKKTRNSLLFLAAGSLLVLSSCTSVPVNHWESIEVPTEAIEAPLPCSELPEPKSFDDIGKGRIQAMRDCADANYDIASEHVIQIEHMRDSVQNLTDAGQAQYNIAQMKQEMLDDERKHNFYTSIAYWVVIIALGAAL